MDNTRAEGASDNPKILIVTGGSRGIGASTARLAANRGYWVCVNYLQNELAADSVVREIRGSGGKAIAIRADISSESEVMSLFEMTERELGPITALVNNAARLETQMRVDSMDAGRLLRMFATNVIGTLLCAREA